MTVHGRGGLLCHYKVNTVWTISSKGVRQVGWDDLASMKGSQIYRKYREPS